MYNAHEITRQFEKSICDYTGAPYCVAVDNQSNALFLCLKYLGVEGLDITIPSHTYNSVPCEIIHAGAKVRFEESNDILTGAYQLRPTNVFDSALYFSADMYYPGTFMCLSFTGPHKTMKLGKAGSILLDNENAYKWLKKARFSGRAECSYHEDNFDEDGVIGWNMYLLPEIAAKGLALMPQFYNLDGSKKKNEPLSIKYPNLSKFKCYGGGKTQNS